MARCRLRRFRARMTGWGGGPPVAIRSRWRFRARMTGWAGGGGRRGRCAGTGAGRAVYGRHDRSPPARRRRPRLRRVRARRRRPGRRGRRCRRPTAAARARSCPAGRSGSSPAPRRGHLVAAIARRRGTVRCGRGRSRAAGASARGARRPTTGLSADGRTLVLVRPTRSFPPGDTRLAVLDARTLRVRREIALAGASSPSTRSRRTAAASTSSSTPRPATRSTTACGRWTRARGGSLRATWSIRARPGSRWAGCR